MDTTLADGMFDKTGDWTGTLDGEEGTAFHDWDLLTDRPATSTILSLLDSDYRIALLNATSSLIDTLTFENARTKCSFVKMAKVPWIYIYVKRES